MKKCVRTSIKGIKILLILASILLLTFSFANIFKGKQRNITETLEEKKERLTDKTMSYYVTKQGGTEKAFNNAYWDNKEAGIYVDVNTGEALFSSLDKYDSGTGWPSFSKAIDTAKIQEEKDTKIGYERTEVRTDESHLGHVFDDGPNGGDRYCINSAAMRFIPFEDLEKEGYEEYVELFPYEKATLAGGCFWGVEQLLSEIEGVISAVSGYTGGTKENPTYSQVSFGNTGHAEAVQIYYDPKIISYSEVLDIFWRLHNPTQKNRQGPDVGTQYRSAIFYHSEEQRRIAEESKAVFDAKKIFRKPAITEIVPASTFYPAEEHHQDYYQKNTARICHNLRKE